MMSDIATRIFDARMKVSFLDDELYTILCESGGIDGNQFEDWHFDGYDSSIEFDKCDPAWRLSPENQKVLWENGFLRCWLNHLDGVETYYWKDGKPEGSWQMKRPAPALPEGE